MEITVVTRLVFMSDGEDGLTFLDVKCEGPRRRHEESYIRDFFKEEFDHFSEEEPPGIYLWSGTIHGWRDPWTGEYDEEWDGDYRKLRDITEADRRKHYRGYAPDTVPNEEGRNQ